MLVAQISKQGRRGTCPELLAPHYNKSTKLNILVAKPWTARRFVCTAVPFTCKEACPQILTSTPPTLAPSLHSCTHSPPGLKRHKA